MGETKEVTLDDLVGEHMLDGVDTFVEKVKNYGDRFEDASAIAFRLGGVVYVAVEDPSDGYRSYIGSLITSIDHKMVNIFPPVRVVARKKADGQYDRNDTLELVDAVTGKIVMEVGTDNSDDYYPSFVACFSPENMATNASQ